MNLLPIVAKLSKVYAIRCMLPLCHRLIALCLTLLALLFLEGGETLDLLPPSSATFPPPRRHYRALLLVLSSTNAPFYVFCRKAWLSIARKAAKSGVKVVLLYGAGSLAPGSETEHDLVVERFPDTNVSYDRPSYPFIRKTLMALEELVVGVDTYDFLIRTNMHCFWDAQALVARLTAMPIQPALSGMRFDVYGGNFSFTSGIDMVLPWDVVPRLLASAAENEATYIELPEDVGLSVILHYQLKIPLLDSWDGEPGGAGPLLWFIGDDQLKASIDIGPAHNRSTVLERLAQGFAAGADHFRLKPSVTEDTLAYTAVRAFTEAVYGQCVGVGKQGGGGGVVEECEPELEAEELAVLVRASLAGKKGALLSPRPPFSSSTRVYK